jgi:hypothetical protein
MPIQLADIRRNRVDLVGLQLMCDRLHNDRAFGMSFLVPAGQLAEDVVGKLTRQTRKFTVTLRVVPMA